MLRRLSRRLSYANVMSTIAVFVAVGTGGAYAANTIGSSDIIDGQVKSPDIGLGEVDSSDVKDQSLTTFDVSTFLGADVVDGTLTGDDIQDSSITNLDILDDVIGSEKVINESLTGNDIGDGSLTGSDIDEASLVGLEDVCPPTMALYLPLCARSDGVNRTWADALQFCRPLGLRLPSLGEGIALGHFYDVPGVADGESFWTEEFAGSNTAYDASESGGTGPVSIGSTRKTVCVTTPSSLYQ